MENAYLKIAEQSKKYGTVQNLMHLVNAENLKYQHKLQSRRKATGIDGIGKANYEENLDENISRLIGSMKNFSYKPQSVKRVSIPKIGSDKLRPLGIPAYEDKLVQGVFANILNSIYENKFKEFSYGFRPNKSCHCALKELNNVMVRNKVGFIVDADISGFFDNVNHEWLVKFLENDIKDKNFIRYIKRFLQSGIMEQGKYIESDKGTPQGGVISPILANIYLHYVLDLWFEKKIQNKFWGQAFIVRYADDFVCCFQHENEAKDFYRLLKERLGKFGLKLSEEKSRIIRFGRYAKEHGSKETFDFLGFTHINATNKNGKYIVVHFTSKTKMTAKREAVKTWLHENRHIDKKELVMKLNIKLIGHYRYYGVTGNFRKLQTFERYAIKELFKTLNRRSQRKLTWEKFNKFIEYNPIAKSKIYVPLY